MLEKGNVFTDFIKCGYKSLSVQTFDYATSWIRSETKFKKNKLDVYFIWYIKTSSL